MSHRTFLPILPPMQSLDNLRPADAAFLERAEAARNSTGPRAVLLLVGSRAAGYAGTHSDLDLWIIGDKQCLSPHERQRYDLRGSLFVDRGDLEAHWTFYDEQDLAKRLGQWHSEMMWIISTAQVLDGHADTLVQLQQKFGRFPRDIAESKLRWLIGQFRSQPSGMWKAAGSGRLPSALAMAGQAIDSLCRVCCVAEQKPWPYTKWLTEVARSTQAGQVLCPFLDRMTQALIQTPRSCLDLPSSHWSPRQHLNEALAALPATLHQLGWHGDWVDDPWKAVDEMMRRECP